MRNIVVLNRISVDGYFASLNEANFGMDWFIPDPEVDKAVREGDGAMDTLIMGRTTYDGFEKGWVPLLRNPDAPPELRAVAEELTRMTKLVFSTTRKEAAWANTELFDGGLVEVVRARKAEDGGGMLIFGSGTVVRQLANAGLIDEYVFIVTPIVAGEGKPMFADVRPFGLRLVGARPFASGNVVLRYEVKS